MDDHQPFGAMLHRLRRAHDLTQEALAQRVYCAVDTIKKIEAGKRHPSPQMAQRLAECLALSALERTIFLQAARSSEPPVATQPLAAPALNTSRLSLPVGTVTFLFTDIEGSTQRWEHFPQAMPEVLDRHDAILRQAIAAHGGVVFQTAGDSFAAAFPTAPAGLAAALAAQRALQSAQWKPPVGPLRVRMALHAGPAELREDVYHAEYTLNHLARVLSAGHGGQILITAAVRELIRDSIPSDVGLRDLGVHRLKDLRRPEPILQVTAEDLTADFPPLKTLDPRRHNLPAQPTPFVGRERELRELHQMLANPDTRLITIAGPGGIGKTRLAIEVARMECESFADGVYFVPLAALDDPELMASPIADALGFSLYVTDQREKWTRDRQRAQLVAYLRERQLLLVLDNLEHLLKDLSLFSAILGAAPGVKILATSRARLDLQGETSFALGGLIYPESELGAGGFDTSTYEALNLFRECARRVQPGFALKAENIGDVVTICRLVEGMPLGIELAAAWVGMLSPAEIVAEIKRNLDFLSSNLRDIPERQRSIRSIFDSSWDKLSQAERDIFAQLSVFQGGFSRQAAQQVTGASLQTLMALVSKSLLQPGSAGRYHAHELLRQFAAERLAAAPAQESAARERHCAYYAAFLAAREADLNGPRQGEALGEIEREIYNVRDAWKWAVSAAQLDYIAQAMESLCEFYRIRGYYEEGWANFEPAALALGWPGHGPPPAEIDAPAQFEEIRRLLESAKAGPSSNGGREEICGKVLARYGRLHCETPQNDWLAIHVRGDALKLLSAAAARREMAYVLRYVAHIGFTPWQARELYGSALGIFQEHGDERGIGETLYRLGLVAAQLGEYHEAERLYRESLDIIGRCGRLEMKGNCLSELGYVYWAVGDYAKAEAGCTEAQAVYARLGNPGGDAYSLMDLARIALVRRDYQQARQLIHDSLRIYDESGLLGRRAQALGELSQVALLEGRLDEAEATALESLRLCHERDYRAGTIVPLMVLGQIANERQNWQAAKHAIHESLQLARAVYMPAYALHGLVGVVRLLLSENRIRLARDIATFVYRHPASWQWTRACMTSVAADLLGDGLAGSREENRLLTDGTALDSVIDSVLPVMK